MAAITPNIQFDFEPFLPGPDHGAQLDPRGNWITPKGKVKGKQICTYWLRGRCMASKECAFMHTFDPAMMPVCKFGPSCSIKGCYFRHPSVEEKGECINYRLGFCPLGPSCTLRHVKRGPDELPEVSEYFTVDLEAESGKSSGAVKSHMPPPNTTSGTADRDEQWGSRSDLEELIVAYNDQSKKLRLPDADTLTPRYFLIKSPSLSMIAKSYIEQKWVLTADQVEVLEKAIAAATPQKTFLYFSTWGHTHFQGVAHLVSNPEKLSNDDTSEDSETELYECGIRWVRTCALPYTDTMRLSNPLNAMTPLPLNGTWQELPMQLGRAMMLLMYSAPRVEIDRHAIVGALESELEHKLEHPMSEKQLLQAASKVRWQLKLPGPVHQEEIGVAALPIGAPRPGFRPAPAHFPGPVPHMRPPHPRPGMPMGPRPDMPNGPRSMMPPGAGRGPPRMLPPGSSGPRGHPGPRNHFGPGHEDIQHAKRNPNVPPHKVRESTETGPAPSRERSQSPQQASHETSTMGPGEAITLITQRWASQPGFLFECDQNTVRECIDRGMFGASIETGREIARAHVEPGTPLLLLNISDGRLLGLFEADSRPGLHVEGALATDDRSINCPDGAPIQVYVRPIIKCPPAPEQAYASVFPSRPSAGSLDQRTLAHLAPRLLHLVPPYVLAEAAHELISRPDRSDQQFSPSRRQDDSMRREKFRQRDDRRSRRSRSRSASNRKDTSRQRRDAFTDRENQRSRARSPVSGRPRVNDERFERRIERPSRRRSRDRNGDRNPPGDISRDDHSRELSRSRNLPRSRSRSRANRPRSPSPVRDRNQTRIRSRSPVRGRNPPRTRSRSQTRDRNLPRTRSRSQTRDRNLPRTRSRSQTRDRNLPRIRSRSQTRNRDAQNLPHEQENAYNQSLPRNRSRSQTRNRDLPRSRSRSQTRNQDPSGTRNRNQARPQNDEVAPRARSNRRNSARRRRQR